MMQRTWLAIFETRFEYRNALRIGHSQAGGFHSPPCMEPVREPSVSGRKVTSIMMSDDPAANGRALETMSHSPPADALLRLPPRRLAVLLSGASERDPSLRRLLVDELRSLPPPADGDTMVGESPAMQLVFDRIRRFAATESPVLIAGESGTGKELAARAMHERSARAGGPFVAINCAALPPSLIASELFGHEKGAFTGAVGRKIGLIERAHGGTLFLDEVGDLPGETQGHLLRFLQDMTLLRVGGTQQLRVDARILSATNVPLAEAIRERRFREDLFYRLAVLELRMPPLRERGRDIELLATFFLRGVSRELARSISGFSPDALAVLRAHPWPGNVRELVSAVRRAVVMSAGPWITASDLDLPARAAVTPPPPAEAPPADPRATLLRALDEANGCVADAARRLRVSRVTVYRMLKRHGIAHR
jgi:DNA-binding NtrC family response regulator